MQGSERMVIQMNIAPDKVFPVFQPIISLDSNQIIGYEVLGRYQNEAGEIISLGSFFNNAAVSNSEHLLIDGAVREQALEQYSAMNSDVYLFININLNWLEHDYNPSDDRLVKCIEEYGISSSNIVIEIIEDNFVAQSDKYIKALSYYKALGFKIAVDDFGKDASNIDRIVMISPDIIKIDMGLIKKTTKGYHYNEYLKMFTLYAQKLGIEILYEGIENISELENCINAKGRFYQGFLLSKPLEGLKNNQFNETDFKRVMYKTIVDNQTLSKSRITLKHTLDSIIYEYMNEYSYVNTTDIDHYLINLSDNLSDNIQRIYICNKYGYQISSNIELCDNMVNLIDMRNRNWAWRNYFVHALRNISEADESYISDIYRDYVTKELVMTYIRKISENDFILIDISLNS